MSKEQAVAQFAPIFSQYGYDGATLTRLSQASGLGKASLYHHFRGGKEDMAAAVLEQFNQTLTATVLAPLTTDELEGPRDRLQAMAANLRQFYANGHTPCLLGWVPVFKYFHQIIPEWNFTQVNGSSIISETIHTM